jgi:hypothetical protein
MKMMMNTTKKFLLVGMMMLTATATYAEDTQVTNECDTTYIKLNENLEPINYVNWAKEDLEAAVGELETILETENFQLYSAGEYTYKIENGMVTSMAVQIEDEKNDKVIYNKILNALAQSKPVKDSHNTGGNFYQYTTFQVQFDDFEGYEKLTFSVIPE